jgi:hypothetical protein
LVLPTLIELLPGDGVVVVGVVVDALLVRIAAIVEQDTSAGDAMFGPVVDGAFVICGWPNDVGALSLLGFSGVCICVRYATYAIVETSSWDMREL